MKKVYFDNAATTCLLPEVIEEMTKVMSELYGNPSSTHSFGRKAKNDIESARRSVAKHFDAQTSEIVFTSGATEANNMIIQHAIHHLGVKRIISSTIEHKAVLDAVINHSKDNVKIDYVKLKTCGTIDYQHLEQLLTNREDKTLVSLMMVNNEIGNILDGKKVAELCKLYGALFHSDTVQYIAHEEIKFREIGIDFATCSAHKFHGPKGIGFLYAAKEYGISSNIYGGGQERGLRPGTENNIGIAGLTKSLALAYANLEEDKATVTAIKTAFKTKLKNTFGELVVFNGNTENNLYTILNVGFSNKIANNMLLFLLDMHGIAASGGSACSSGSNQGSHVLNAIESVSEEYTAIRFSFCKKSTLEEVDYTIEKLKEILNHN